MSIDTIKQISQFNNTINRTSADNTAGRIVDFAQILNGVVSGNQTLENYINLATTNSKASDESASNTTLKTDLEDIFAKAAATYDVPEELLKAVAKAESGFNPDAVSKCGAMGVMQLMPATAQALGVTNAYDPEQNIMGGAKYLSQKLKAYDGDITLALASYNAGSGNVAKYGGVPPFPETQNYITKVLGYMDENVELPEQVSWGSGDINLDEISATSGQTFSEMGSEKAYYVSQMQILQHQLKMQELFTSNLNEEDEQSDSYLNQLMDSFIPV